MQRVKQLENNLRINIPLILVSLIITITQVFLVKTIDMAYKQYYEQQYDEELKTLHDAYNLRTISQKEGNVVGIYFANNGMFIKTKGQSLWEINETVAHESCHNYIFTNRKHFCW